MGGAHSVGRDNDELVDALIKENYILTKEVEKAFRNVDRGDYINGYSATELYGADKVLRKPYAHLSAPVIYAKVVESLEMVPGNSFLNIGSGTGYLSTIVGYLIGAGAVNHGLEVSKEALDHSYNCLEKYITSCIMFDATSLAIPIFVLGNGLDISTSFRKYDKIYVGAEVPQSHKRMFCMLLSENGKLVMPCNNELVCVTREVDTFTIEKLMSVSFRPLVTHETHDEDSEEEEEMEQENINSIEINVRIQGLQELCRCKLYGLLGRENLARVRELPVNALLQDYIVYYRDPDLPAKRERPVYEEPPPAPRSRIHAILQHADEPPRIGEYVNLVERLIAERGGRGYAARARRIPEGAEEEGAAVEEEEDDIQHLRGNAAIGHVMRVAHNILQDEDMEDDEDSDLSDQSDDLSEDEWMDPEEYPEEEPQEIPDNA